MGDATLSKLIESRGAVKVNAGRADCFDVERVTMAAC